MHMERTSQDVSNMDRDKLLSRAQDGVDTTHLMASMEYTLDLALDMIIMMMDCMLDQKIITLSELELETYNKLKAYQKALYTFSLNKPKFDIDGREAIDYIFYFKDVVMKRRAEYFEIRKKLEI